MPVKFVKRYKPKCAFAHTRKTVTKPQKLLTHSELLDLKFGAKIKVIWHNSKHHSPNEEHYGIIFGDKIGYKDGKTDETRTIAECVFNEWCKIYLVK